MTTRIRVEQKGLPELIKALRSKAGAGEALTKAFHEIGLKAVSASRRMAPVDTGKLRNSIFYEVDWQPLPTYVKIGVLGGPTAGYAAYMEYGTGLVHDHPSWPRKRHVVPPQVLEGWVARKGRFRGEKAKARRERLARVSEDAASAAWAITRRGGLMPRRYLRTPFEADKDKYVARITRAIRQMKLTDG